jgi:sugar O-acyltransferase (sialic acid O-acetyltransferase NeuD family)
MSHKRLVHKRLVIVGAGGFAREVRWLAQEITAARGPAEGYDFVGYVVSDPSAAGPHDSRPETLGDLSWLASHREAWDVLALGIGNPAPRLKVAAELEDIWGKACWPALVHPTVRMDAASCHVGHGALLCAGVIGTVNLIFEPFAMVNLSCTIGHEAVIGRAACLNPTVNISGGVTIGPGVLVGTGAQVLQYVEVGAGATVGAGAVVSKPVPAGITVVGIPAKPLAPRG